MTHKNRRKRRKSLKKMEEKLVSHELQLHEEALKLDRKRKTLYIQ